MSIATITPVLPDLDRPDADQIGDEILLISALADHKAIGKVKASSRRSASQSHSARAWTNSGDVD